MPASFQFGAPVAEQINANGQDVVDVLMYNWGVNVKDSYPPVLFDDGVTVKDINNPDFPFTPQAIMIGPRSTIDRAFVAWNYQAGSGIQTRTMVRVLSLDAPLLFPQTSGEGGIKATDADPIIAGAQGRGLLYVTPHVFPVPIAESANPGGGIQEGYMTTLLPDQILRTNGSAQDFYDQSGSSRVMLPILHLQFYLKASGLAQPIKRFPFHNAMQLDILDPNTEELLMGWPVYGRKTIAFQVSSAAADTTIRIAALRNVQRNYRIQETTEGEKTLATANVSERFRFCDIAADYLLLYASTPSIAPRTVKATIAAYD